jgi:hypothetical protein
MSQTPPSPRRIPLWRDVYRGAIRGDWANEKGIAGHLTQAAMGFIPVIQTICAYRDFRACRYKKDRIGMVLNGIALIPFLGLFPKTAAVLRSAKDIGDTSMLAKNVGERYIATHSQPKTSA